MINTRSVDGRALLATVGNYWRNGTQFTISHLDHLTPLGAGGGSPLVNAVAQLVTDPENFGAWATIGTIVRTGGQADPLGGVAAYYLDSNGSSADSLLQTVTFTGNATKAFAIYMRTLSSSQSSFQIWDATASTMRLEVTVTWSGGIPTLSVGSGAGTLYAVADVGNGWYRLMAAANGVIAANTNQFKIFPDSSGGLGQLYVFGANAWNSITPSSYVGSSQPTAATGDSLYLDGATASIANWLRAGDIMSVSGILPIYEATADVSSEANGFVRVPINPPLFVSGPPADNAAVTITGVTMTAVILEPPTFPTTSAASADYGELVVRFSESL